MFDVTRQHRSRGRYFASLAIIGIGIVTIGNFARALPVAGLASAACEPDARALVIDNVSMSDQVSAPSATSSYAMSMQASLRQLPAGPVTFIAANEGTMIHDLVVTPMPTGGPQSLGMAPSGAAVIPADSAVASASCAAGTGSGILPGSSGWVTVNLRPGTYLLMSSIPWQVQNGMYTTITVG